jgi:hypothetical protein
MTRQQLSRSGRHRGSSTSSSHSLATTNARSNTAPAGDSERSLFKYHQKRPGVNQHHLGHVEHPYDIDDFRTPRSSVRSASIYDSSVLSDEDLGHISEFEIPNGSHAVYASDAIPSTPAEFAEFFPSNRRLLINHDDTTSDGNMNLRVDTEIFEAGGRSRKLTLFHLQMHDLKDRDFSLRRHCRESRRQVCSSSSRHLPSLSFAPKSSYVQPSFDLASQQLRLFPSRSVSSNNSNSNEASSRDLVRADSPSATALCLSNKQPSFRKTIQLDFANYAQIDVNKIATKRSDGYGFEFWGTKYEWRCQTYQFGSIEEVSYHLLSDKTSKSIAHITPTALTAREAQEEEAFGGWVPPCTMRITDSSGFRSLTEIAE